MSILKKIFIITLFVISYLNANTFIIKEPILNSNIYINIEGDKNNEVIVFVHGLGDEASAIWYESIKKLKNNYCVITFDLPGFGKSSKGNAEYTPEKYAYVLNYIYSKYINKPFYLVGHSMGGAISIKYTILFQNNVKKLLLIDSAGILHKDAYGKFLIKMGVNKFINPIENTTLNTRITNFVSKISEKVNKIEAENNFDLYNIVRNDELRNIVFQSNPMAIAASGLVTETYYDINKIEIPTLILWGENDDIAPLRIGYILNKLIKNSQLSIIKNSKHVPIIDSKDIYLSYLDIFLNSDITSSKKNKYEMQNEKSIDNLNNTTTIDCNYKNLKISNSNNILLNNCNIENLFIENSTVWLLNSEINSTDTAIKIVNSSLNATSTNINSNIGIISFNSRLDLAAVTINATKYGIHSRGTNHLIFSLTNIKSSINDKIFHDRFIMWNDNVY